MSKPAILPNNDPTLGSVTPYSFIRSTRVAGRSSISIPRKQLLTVRVTHILRREVGVIRTWLRYCDGSLKERLGSLRDSIYELQPDKWSVDDQLIYLVSRLIDQKFRDVEGTDLLEDTRFLMELDRLGLVLEGDLILLPGGSWSPLPYISLALNDPSSLKRVLTWSLMDHAKRSEDNWVGKV